MQVTAMSEHALLTSSPCPQTISDPALGDNIENSENITLLKTWIKKSLLVDMFLKLLSCMEVPLVLEGL